MYRKRANRATMHNPPTNELSRTLKRKLPPRLENGFSSIGVDPLPRAVFSVVGGKDCRHHGTDAVTHLTSDRVSIGAVCRHVRPGAFPLARTSKTTKLGPPTVLPSRTPEFTLFTATVVTVNEISTLWSWHTISCEKKTERHCVFLFY